MALTRCKECDKEVSTEAKTCPYCGIDHPGVDEGNPRFAGIVVVSGLIIMLGIYLFAGHEKSGNPNAENAGVLQSVAEPAKPPAPIAPTQPPSPETTPQPSAEQEPAAKEPGLTETNTAPLSRAESPEMLVLRMLDYALDDGGLKHEAEIRRIKQLIESLPRPAIGNKKAAKDMNAKGLASAKKGDFNTAAALFEKANTLDQSDIEIVNNLGFSYLKQGNTYMARQALLTALALSPGRTEAWLNLAEVFGLEGDAGRARACFSLAYRFSKDPIKLNRTLKNMNENEPEKQLKQARAEAIKWAEKSFLKN